MQINEAEAITHHWLARTAPAYTWAECRPDSGRAGRRRPLCGSASRPVPWLNWRQGEEEEEIIIL